MQPDFLTTPFATQKEFCHSQCLCRVLPDFTPSIETQQFQIDPVRLSDGNLAVEQRKEFRKALKNRALNFYDGETLKMRCDIERANTYQSVNHKWENRVFRKSTSCPSTYQLLNYYRTCRTQDASRAGSASNPLLEHTALHLATCDFCSAEFELLLHHPPADSASTSMPECEPKPVPMPAHLYALAHSLLFNPTASPKTLFFHGDEQQLALTTVDS